MTKLLDYKALFEDYAAYHVHPTNRLLHCLGIPLVVFCVVRWSQVGPAHFPCAAAALLLYAAWDLRLALGMAVATAGMAAIGPLVPGGVAWGLFALGWTLQFLGHWAFEGKSPAFANNFLHLLVGPAFILHELTGVGLPR